MRNIPSASESIAFTIAEFYGSRAQGTGSTLRSGRENTPSWNGTLGALGASTAYGEAGGVTNCPPGERGKLSLADAALTLLASGSYIVASVAVAIVVCQCLRDTVRRVATSPSSTSLTKPN